MRRGSQVFPLITFIEGSTAGRSLSVLRAGSVLAGEEERDGNKEGQENGLVEQGLSTLFLKAFRKPSYPRQNFPWVEEFLRHLRCKGRCPP